ncbi:hypothetical protein Sf25_gp5 [Shigella phage Sf25]|uniref:Uncharacterized protein n=1 Tax=Shigella phage Sf25 TaxID=2024310 RepID=A0A2K9VLP9_9CAUD|nr:hypothetical protein Sf25_gp5 [Shigella phage Sf25]
MSADLGESMEGSSIDVTFTAQLETGETLVSINITSYEETPGVLVEENRLYGTYESVFGFGNDALKYRLDVGGDWTEKMASMSSISSGQYTIDGSRIDIG